MLHQAEPDFTLTLPGRATGFGARLEEATRPWRRRPLGIIGAALILFLVLAALTAPLIAPYSGGEFAGTRLESPSNRHLFGTNNLGQDVFSRTLYGAQISIAVGFTTTLIGVGAGALLGLFAAFFGGALDQMISRALEVLASFPNIMLALLVVAALGRPQETDTNILQIAWQLRALELAIAMGFMFGVMRVVRSAVLAQRSLPYVEAATTIGAGNLRIMFRHIFPNVFPVVIVAFSSIIGAVILIEAGLSFLGYGVALGTPSWGIDLSNQNREYFVEAPWLLAAPGIAVSLAVLGFNFLGDTLRDILDPRMRGSR
jgi:peptide/nickel transport system permease protein